MKKGIYTGLFLGMLLGFTASCSPLLLIGFPGFLIYSVRWREYATDGPPDGIIIYFTVVSLINMFIYGLLGTLLGWYIARRKKLLIKPSIPECSICGYKWITPTSSICPGCGHEKTFQMFMLARNPEITCEKCNYNLTGNESGICPECGEII